MSIVDKLESLQKCYGDLPRTDDLQTTRTKFINELFGLLADDKFFRAYARPKGVEPSEVIELNATYCVRSGRKGVSELWDATYFEGEHHQAFSFFYRKATGEKINNYFDEDINERNFLLVRYKRNGRLELYSYHNVLDKKWYEADLTREFPRTEREIESGVKVSYWEFPEWPFQIKRISVDELSKVTRNQEKELFHIFIASLEGATQLVINGYKRAKERECVPSEKERLEKALQMLKELSGE